jgi:16S rRNA (guanine966-N2)-methyltransferase
MGEQRLRIVAGTLRGRTVRAPKGGATRPTTDRVREAIFSTLASLAGPNLGGGPVLDAFSGTGALGLESLSRGARPVVFVEKNRAALQALERNIEELTGSNDARIVRSDVFSLAKRGVAGGPFSLILLDPPYTLDQSIVAGLLTTLASSGAVTRGCHVIWEHTRDVDITWPPGFALVAEKHYGTTSVGFAVYEGGAER